MSKINAKIDENRKKTLLGVTDDVLEEYRPIIVDPITGRVKVQASLSTGVLVTEWFLDKTYSINNVVTYSGVIYVSLQNTNLNNTPSSSPTFWAVYAGLLDTDVTLAADSDSKVASQHATKTYVDTSINNLPKPFTFKGGIGLPADFPTLALVQPGWLYAITANVTDNDASKTNTGLSFVLGDEIVWNGTTWTNIGPNAIWKRTGANVSPVNAGDSVSVDTITEQTLNNGVSIEGINLKDNDISLLDSVQFNLTPTETTAEGKMMWDSTSDTLQVGLTGGTVALQVGQEMVIRAKNAEVAQINNGQIVYISGASGSKPKMKLASNDVDNSLKTIAIATENIAAGSDGYYTTYGLVHDVDTHLFTAGDPLWIGTTPGSFVNVKPTNPNHCVSIGYVIFSDVTAGIIYFHVDLREIEQDRQLTKDPTGFSQPDNVIVTYDSATQKVTLTGNVEGYFQGEHVAVLSSGWVSSNHTNTVGHQYFLYYDGTNFQWATDITPPFYNLFICRVSYGATDKYATRECHGTMGWMTHEYFHKTIGTVKEAGGTFSSYVLASTTAANRRPDISSTTVDDEDLRTINSALTSKLYTKTFLTTTGITNYTVETADIIPLLVNNPYYNKFTTPNWVQTLMPEDSVASVWIYAVPCTASAGSQKYRYVFIQPQWISQSQNSSSGAMAIALSNELLRSIGELNLGTFTTETLEYIAIGRIIVEYTGGNWDLMGVYNLAGSRLSQTGSPSGKFLSVVATGTGLSGNGTSTSPLSTTLSTGLSGGQTIIGSTLTNEDLNIKSNAVDLTTGSINFLDSLEASSTTVASVTMAGGLAINKRLWTRDLTVTNAPTFTAMTKGSVLFAGASGLLSQNNANFNWNDASKALVIGPNTGTSTSAYRLCVSAVAGGTIGMGYFSTGIYSYFTNVRINGSIASPTKVLAGDEIARFDFKGQYDTTTDHIVVGAKISVFAEADYTALNAMPTYLSFCTAKAGGYTADEHFRVTSEGRIRVLDSFGATPTSSGLLELGDSSCGLWRASGNNVTTAGNYTLLGGYAGIIFTTGSAAVGSQTIMATLTTTGLGIGMTPTQIVDILSANGVVRNTSTTAGGFVQLQLGNATDGPTKQAALYRADAGAASWGGASNVVLHNVGSISMSTNTTDAYVERFRITNAGVVTMGNLTFKNLTASGSSSAPVLMGMGVNYSDSATRNKCKIMLYDNANDEYGFSIGGPGDIQYHSNVYHRFFITNTLTMEVGSGRIQMTNVGTTASAANVNFDASKNILLVTSSSRYKTDVETLEDSYSENIYKMRPVWYRSLASADNKDWSWYGLIAEEMAEIEPRLVHWKYPDEDFIDTEVTEKAIDGKDMKVIRKVLKEGSKLIPNGIQYERLTVLLIAEVQKLNERIKILETK